MNRIVWIDISKAICIVLVVIGHYIPDTHPVWYGELHDVIYSFHMPLFMFASGFVYIATKRDVGYRDFLVKKIKRLMVPYLVVSVLIITIKLCTQGHAYMENPVTPLSYLKIFYLPEAGYFLWFIWALWWMFVIVPCFKTPYSRLFLLCAAVFLPTISSHLPKIFCLNQFSGMLQYFVAGIVVYDWGRYLMWCKNTPLYVVCVLFCLVEAMPYFGMGIIPLITAFVGIAVILKISYEMEKLVRTASWGSIILTISSASYIIYLLHTTFEGFAKAIVFKTPYLSNQSNDSMFSVGAIIVVSAGVAIPVLLYKYVLRRFEVTKTLFGLK